MNEVTELKINLSQFLHRIKNTKKEDYDENLKNSIYMDYKELYQLYSTLSKKQIVDTFTKEEIKAIHCLSLGLENEHKFNELILNFDKTAAKSMLNVADYISSRAGFDLINKDSDFSNFNDEELVGIFGSLFGIQITKECVKSLKTEKIGRVIGYAISELFDQHILEFREAKALNPNLDLCTFIKDKVQSNDFECSYVYNEIGNNLDISCYINRLKSANLTDVRGNNRIDHCFVNDEEKTIIFGQSTSNKDTQKQGYSFFKAYVVLENLVLQQTIDGKPNPYYGYKLKPYLMLAGRFVVDKTKTNQESGKGLKKMLPNVTSEELITLAQMQYFRYYGNAVNSQQVNSLPLFNVYIAGCDTTNLYEFSEKFVLKHTDIEKNKFCFSMLSEQLVKTCTILSKNQLSFVNGGGKGDLHLLLNDVHAIAKNIFVNFPHKISNQEYEKHIKPLHQAINDLCTVLNPIAGQFGNNILNDLIDINDKFESQTAYNNKIKKVIVSNIDSINWIKKAPKEIVWDSNDLNVVVTIGNSLKNTLGTTGKQFLTKFNQVIESKLKGYPLDASCLNPTSFRANMSNVKKVLQKSGHENVSEFINKSKFIIDERLTPEKHQKEAIKLIDYLTKLIEIYPEIKEVLVVKRNKKLKN